MLFHRTRRQYHGDAIPRSMCDQTHGVSTSPPACRHIAQMLAPNHFYCEHLTRPKRPIPRFTGDCSRSDNVNCKYDRIPETKVCFVDQIVLVDSRHQGPADKNLIYFSRSRRGWRIYSCGRIAVTHPPFARRRIESSQAAGATHFAEASGSKATQTTGDNLSTPDSPAL